MKKTRLTFLLLVSSTIVFGQISTTTIAPKIENKIPYDSSQNYLKGDIYKYIGQDLYVKGKFDKLREYGYSGFCLDYTKDMGKLSNTYKPQRPKNESYEKYDLGGGNTDYNFLVGRYFKVIDIVTTEGTTIPFIEYGKDYNKNYFLKLVNKETNDTIYYHYDGYEHNFPFIVGGFIEEQKKKLVGKEFVFHNSEFEGATDIQTGKEITIITGQKWKCIDLTIEGKYYELSLVFENSLGQRTVEEFDRVINVAYPATKADNYKKKFGLEKWILILKGKVQIGMTKEMCKLSWGEPDDINTTITLGKKWEQWVYSDNYLYFENGVLTAMQ
ncbi:MAG: hypothetical protein PHT25_00755 [Bacteroidales bacterium]|nr:hypothetical protein [Bacteroidales bacterium]